MSEGWNFAYLDEQTKRMIRRALLKAVAVPGYQVPFGSREMPLPYGWGTGGIQVTAAVIGPDDTLKVIDQGADDTTNRSEEHTSELQSLMPNSYAVLCMKKKKTIKLINSSKVQIKIQKNKKTLTYKKTQLYQLLYLHNHENTVSNHV